MHRGRILSSAGNLLLGSALALSQTGCPGPGDATPLTPSQNQVSTPITNPGTTPITTQPPTTPDLTSPLSVNAGPDITIDSSIQCVSLKGSYSGGKAPYTIAWTAVNDRLPAGKSAVSACPPETRTYFFTVKDGRGIQVQDSMVVTKLLPQGTGIAGLETPEKILQNESVQNALEEFVNNGVHVPFTREPLNPTNIAKTYRLLGTQIYPSKVEVPEGTLEWVLLGDDRIRTTLAGGLAGALPGASYNSVSSDHGVVRGDLSEMISVYTVQDTTVTYPGGNCTIQNVLLFTGKKAMSGEIVGTYEQMPLQSDNAACVPFATAGVFRLVPSGTTPSPTPNITSTLDIQPYLEGKGYHTDCFGCATSIPLPADVFASYGITLSSVVPYVYQYLRPDALGGTTPVFPTDIGKSIDGLNLVDHGYLENPWLINFNEPKTKRVRMHISDGNTNVQTYRLTAFSANDGIGVILDEDVFYEPKGDTSGDIVLDVSSPHPIGSVWMHPSGAHHSYITKIEFGR